MRNRIYDLKTKYMPYLVFLMIPLETLPFIFEQDSIAGKILLICKLVFAMTLYFLNFDVIEKSTHILVGLTVISMAISTILNGEIGVFILLMTLFLLWAALPKISLSETVKRRFFLTMGCGAIIPAILGIVNNLRNSRALLDFQGSVYNANSFGLVFLAALFYFVSCLALVKGKNSCKHIAITAVSLVLVYLIVKSGCRSALLSFAIAAVAYILIAQKNGADWLHYFVVLFSVFLGFFVTYISIKNGLGFADESSHVYGLQLLGKSVFSGRDLLWKTVLKGISSKPVFGAGSEYLMNISGLSSTHNVYLGILLSMGLLPALLYLRFLLRRDRNCDLHNSVGSICFSASVLTAAFECTFTDSRLNFLFLPLLLGSSISWTDTPSEMNTSKRHASRSYVHQYGYIAIFVLSLVALVICNNIAFNDRWITDNSSHGISVETQENLLDEAADRLPKVSNGIYWDWDGSVAQVTGTAAGTSIYDLFNETDKMPEWYIPGQHYKIAYQSQGISFRVLFYDSDGISRWLIDTREETTFAIPEEAKGLIIGLIVYPQERVHELVEPILCIAEQ